MNNNINTLDNNSMDYEPEAHIGDVSKIKSYTTAQITEEMNMLACSFDVVRLVNPYECRIVRTLDNTPADNNDECDNCFDVWSVPYQCANCTSARAMLTKRTQSKLETTDDDIFQVTSRPVIVDGAPLVLEIVKHFSYTYNRYSSASERKKLVSTIKALNSQLLLDKETDAYNRDYLAEHIPNLFYNAKKTHQTNTALIHIEHLYDITQNEGSMAASGIICSLYSLLKQIFYDETDTGMLFVRCSPDTFFVLESSLNYDNFKKRIMCLPLEASPKHLLFNNKRLPLDISIACADLGNEDINSEEELFEILKTRMEKVEV